MVMKWTTFVVVAALVVVLAASLDPATGQISPPPPSCTSYCRDRTMNDTCGNGWIKFAYPTCILCSSLNNNATSCVDNGESNTTTCVDTQSPLAPPNIYSNYTSGNDLCDCGGGYQTVEANNLDGDLGKRNYVDLYTCQ